MTRVVFQLSVALHESAEAAVGSVFEELFGRAPSIYIDEDTRKTTASIT